MDKCIDKKLGAKLYAYEIDLLDEAEKEEFEMHLLECKYCNGRAQEFAKEAEIIRSDALFHQHVSELDAKTTKIVRSKGNYIKIALALAAVLILLVLRPWQIEIHSNYNQPNGRLNLQR